MTSDPGTWFEDGFPPPGNGQRSGNGRSQPPGGAEPGAPGGGSRLSRTGSRRGRPFRTRRRCLATGRRRTDRAPYGPPVPYTPAPYAHPRCRGRRDTPSRGCCAAAADRDRTMDVLKAAYGEGRLTKEEFDERCSRVLSARTYARPGRRGRRPAGRAVQRGGALPAGLLPGAVSRRRAGCAVGVADLRDRRVLHARHRRRARGHPRPRGARADQADRGARRRAWPSPGSSSATCGISLLGAVPRRAAGRVQPALTRFPWAFVTAGWRCPAAWWTGRRRRLPAGPRRGRSSSSASCLPSASRAACACG